MVPRVLFLTVLLASNTCRRQEIIDPTIHPLNAYDGPESDAAPLEAGPGYVVPSAAELRRLYNPQGQIAFTSDPCERLRTDFFIAHDHVRRVPDFANFPRAHLNIFRCEHQDRFVWGMSASTLGSRLPDGGAWSMSISVTNLQRIAGPNTGGWILRHRSLLTITMQEGISYRTSHFQMRDLNGDHVPELLVGVERLLSNSADAGAAVPFDREFRIYSVQNERLMDYPPTQTLVLDSAEDVDGDGRLDLRYQIPPAADQRLTPRISGVLLVAHGLPDGTFSTNDAVALQKARETCGERPATLASMSMDVRSVQCARLWGYEANAVVAEVRRRCTGAWGGLFDPSRGCPRAELETAANGPMNNLHL